VPSRLRRVRSRLYARATYAASTSQAGNDGIVILRDGSRYVSSAIPTNANNALAFVKLN
jgi:hypothetical protein